MGLWDVYDDSGNKISKRSLLREEFTTGRILYRFPEQHPPEDLFCRSWVLSGFKPFSIKRNVSKASSFFHSYSDEIMLVWRLCFAVWFYVSWHLDIVYWPSEWKGFGVYFRYFTDISLVIELAYVILLGVAQVFVYSKLHRRRMLMSQQRETNEKGTVLEEQSTQTSKASRAFFTVVFLFKSYSVPVSTFVLLFYWTLLARVDPYFASYFNFFKHGLNSVVLNIDFFISNMPVYLLEILVVIIVGIGYLIFNISWSLTGHPPIYYPLDWSNDPGLATIISFLIFFVLMPMFLVIYYILNLGSLKRIKSNVLLVLYGRKGPKEGTDLLETAASTAEPETTV